MAGSFKKTRLISTGFSMHNATKSLSKTSKPAFFVNPAQAKT